MTYSHFWYAIPVKHGEVTVTSLRPRGGEVYSFVNRSAFFVFVFVFFGVDKGKSELFKLTEITGNKSLNMPQITTYKLQQIKYWNWMAVYLISFTRLRLDWSTAVKRRSYLLYRSQYLLESTCHSINKRQTYQIIYNSWRWCPRIATI